MNSIGENPYATFASKKWHNFVKFGSECIKSLVVAIKTFKILSLIPSINRLIDAILWLSKALFRYFVTFPANLRHGRV